MRRLLTGIVLFTGLASQVASAGDLLGFYVGGALGQAQVRTDASGFSTQDFSENHSAFKVMVGMRAISVLGGELEYVDLGRPAGILSSLPAHASAKGTAAFGLLYLPIPLPILDIYGKVGVSRLQTALHGNLVTPGCTTACSSLGAFSFDNTRSGLAAGAGVQLSVGSLAVRAEYERFGTALVSPDLVSLGMTWSLF
jgi:opacity protein-like surface antigen